jgi:hypothetical protein
MIKFHGLMNPGTANLSAAPIRIPLASVLLAIALISTACPGNKPEGNTGQTSTSNGEPQTPLKDTPGLHLVYTVNDPLGAVFNATLTARVLIASPYTAQREVLFEFQGFIFHTVASPRGDFIAFVGTVRGSEGQEERHLFLYDLIADEYFDCSTAGMYTRAVKSAPAFTPDGRSVLFVSRWSLDSGDFNVFICDVQTGQVRGLYTQPVEDTPLAITPDGKRCIAVKRDPVVPGDFDYISIDIATGMTGRLHRFTKVTKVGPASFDPSGNTIYCDIKPFESGEGLYGGVRSRLVVALDLASDRETVLFDPTTVTYVYQVFPDESGSLNLLLRRQEAIEGEETPMSRIAISGIDGSDFTYLTDTSARCYLLPPPSNILPLSPDYSLLFFYRQDPLFDNEDIWVMKPDGSDPVNISNTAGFTEGSAGWIVIPEK